MSVAFRRESDEEHKEPRFELPLPPGPNLVTPRGLKLIEGEVAARESIVAAGGEVEALEDTKRALRYWRTRLATAQVAPAASGEEVAFGTRVVFRLGGKPRTIDIVGGDEADPANDRLAFFAPLAQALMGAGVGDFADFNGKPDAIEVTTIAPLPDTES